MVDSRRRLALFRIAELPTMEDIPLLSPDERQALVRNRWFASLSPALRHDLLRHGVVRRLRDGECLFERGGPATSWGVVARGAVRVGFTSSAGQKFTLGYMRPGSWFSALTVLQDSGFDYDAHARGSTTLLTLAQADVRAILQRHPELHEALVGLHARRTRQLFELVDDLKSLSLRARLAKQLGRLAKGFGVPGPDAVRITLPITQEEVAQLVGASRQRVNRELQDFRRLGFVRVEAGRLLVCDAQALHHIASGAEVDDSALHPFGTSLAFGRPAPVATLFPA